MTYRPLRWQYQQKAEPLEPIVVPDFGWFQQHPEPQLSKPIALEGYFTPILSSDETPPSFPAKIDWYQQYPEPQPKPIRGQSQNVLVDALTVVPEDLDWWVQRLEPQPKPTRPEGQTVEGFVPIVSSFDWFVQYPEPQPELTAPEGSVAEGFVPIVPALDWYVQHPEPQPRPTVLHSQNVLVDALVVVPEDFDWFVLSADVFRPPHLVREGGSVEGFVPIVPALDWYQQYPEPQPLPTAPDSQSVLVDALIIISFDFDWHQQHPEPQPLPTTPEGTVVEGFVPIVPSFDWHVQHPEPQLLPTAPESQNVLVDALPVVAFDFDWFQQYPEPQPKPVTPEGTIVEGFVPIVSSFDWFVLPADVTRPLHQTRLGYYVLVEFNVPVPPDVIDLDWYVQHPEPQPLPIAPEGYYVLGQPPIIEVAVSTSTTVIFGGETRLYQTRAEPLLPIEVIPDFGWFVQHPEPQSKPTRLFSQSVLVDALIIVEEDFDWYIQYPEPQPLPTAPEGFVAEGFVPIVPALDWFVPPADVIRPRHQTRPGYYVLVEFDIPIPPEVIDLDWFVQHPEPQPELIAPEGFVAEGFLPSIPSFGWFVQQPEPQPKPTREQSQSVLVDALVVVLIDFGWFTQYPEPQQPSGRPEGLSVLVDALPVVVFDFDWWVQHPEPQPLPTTLEGYFVLGQPPIVSEFGWFVQQLEPQPSLRRPEGVSVLVESLQIVVPDFGWFVQHPEPQPLPIAPEGYYARVDLVAPIPDFDWFVQEADIFPIPPVEPGLFVQNIEPLPTIVPDFGWFVQHIEFILPLPPVEPGWFAVPPRIIPSFTPPLEYFIQICLVLWELQQNGLLPDPSSFLRILVSFTASGYTKEDDDCFLDEDLPAPSGYEADEDATENLETLVKEDLPPPSGYVRP